MFQMYENNKVGHQYFVTMLKSISCKKAKMYGDKSKIKIGIKISICRFE